MVEEHLINKKKSIITGISKSESLPADYKMLGNDLNRDIAVHSVKRKLEKFESTLLADVQRKMDNVIEDIIQEIQQYELNAREFKEFAQEQHNQIWSNRINTTSTTTGVEKKSVRKQLPEKIFIPRDSYLTSLLEVNHMKSIYYISYIIFSIVVTQNLLLSYLKRGSFNIGLKTISIGFKNFDYVIFLWILMELAVFGLYFLFKLWAKVRFTLRKNPLLQGLWSYVNLIGFIVFQFTFAGLATATCSGFDFSFVSSCVILLEMTRFMMKMHSFIRYNVPRQLAGKSKTDKNEEESTTLMPKFSSYVYFLVAPTLLYRDSYPRTKQIRWRFVFGKAVEMFSVLLFLGSVHDTYIYPYFSKTGIEKTTFLELTEKGFSMILPGVMMFLCGFFCILHIWQNFTSEILMFADRMFYKDWWTSKNYETYYRNWNVIVHDWLYEYIYKDMYTYVCKGSKPLASLAVFAASAFVHEYIMAFALRFVYPALSGFFLFSVILLFLMKKLNANVGNLFLWWSLVVGNSILIMVYSLEFFARKNCQIGNDWIDYIRPVSWYCNGLEN